MSQIGLNSVNSRKNASNIDPIQPVIPSFIPAISTAYGEISSNLRDLNDDFVTGFFKPKAIIVNIK